MLCVGNYAANVVAGTLYTLLVWQTAWLQWQHGLPNWTQSLESRSHGGGGCVSLDSRAGSGEESLPPPPSSVSRALVWSGISASNTSAQDPGKWLVWQHQELGGGRSGFCRVTVVYYHADWDPSSTAVSNRLHVAFITALLIVVFMEGGTSKDGKSDSWPHTTESSHSDGPLIPRDTNMPWDPVTGDCSAAPVENSQLLVDGRQ